MAFPAWQYRSAVPGVSWPAIPGQEGASLLALQFQLERTQWLPPARLLELQFSQLEGLMRHAYDTVPYYRERWRGLYDPGAPLTPERFAQIPLLTRRDLQTHFDTLKSTAIPSAHGATAESRTSGSTGTPVRVLKTALCELWWRVFTLRDHVWHRRNLDGKLAAIRQGMKAAESDGWGVATDPIVTTGILAMLSVGTDVGAQLEWLEKQRPDYLITHPTNLAELARRSLAQGVRLPGLREARTSGEMLPQETRDLCREAWGVAVRDMYSVNEVGYIALQCPEHEHYHVQAEGVMVEVLDDGGLACAPGQIGRVVLTSLHNFATPLLRYDIGDYAEVGPLCSCGRGLQVLRRIVGRVRNMLVLASGERYWPNFGLRGLADAVPLRQYQLVQKGYDLLEARLVTASKLTTDQEDKLREQLLSRLPTGFRVDVVYCEVVARGEGGKFEDFVSEVGPRP
jgi:phenylacetate-CoA ligase